MAREHNKEPTDVVLNSSASGERKTSIQKRELPLYAVKVESKLGQIGESRMLNDQAMHLMIQCKNTMDTAIKFILEISLKGQ